jgi:hypothetical protein
LPLPSPDVWHSHSGESKDSDSFGKLESILLTIRDQLRTSDDLSATTSRLRLLVRNNIVTQCWSGLERTSRQLCETCDEQSIARLRHDSQSFFLSDKLALQIEKVVQTKADSSDPAQAALLFRELHQIIVQELSVERSRLLLDSKQRDLIASFKVSI